MRQTLKNWKVLFSALLVGGTTYGITRWYGGWPFPNGPIVNEFSNFSFVAIIALLMIALLVKYVKKTSPVERQRTRARRPRRATARKPVRKAARKKK